MGFKPSTSRHDAPLFREGDISVYLRRSPGGTGFYNIRDRSGGNPVYMSAPYEIMGAKIHPRHAVDLYHGQSLLEVELTDDDISDRIKNPTTNDLKHDRLTKWEELQASNRLRPESERVAIMGPLAGKFANGPSEIAVIPDGVVESKKEVNGVTYHNKGLRTAFAFVRYSSKDVAAGLRFRLPVEDCEQFVSGESASEMKAMLQASEDGQHVYLDVSIYHRVGERIIRLSPRDCLDLVRGNSVEAQGCRFTMESIEVKPSTKGGYYSNAVISGEALMTSAQEKGEVVLHEPEEDDEDAEQGMSM